MRGREDLVLGWSTHNTSLREDFKLIVAPPRPMRGVALFDSYHRSVLETFCSSLKRGQDLPAHAVARPSLASVWVVPVEFAGSLFVGSNTKKHMLTTMHRSVPWLFQLP